MEGVEKPQIGSLGRIYTIAYERGTNWNTSQFDIMQRPLIKETGLMIYYTLIFKKPAVCSLPSSKMAITLLLNPSSISS